MDSSLYDEKEKDAGGDVKLLKIPVSKKKM
jgi:hypothetical protein